jgi:hypothetical protein
LCFTAAAVAQGFQQVVITSEASSAFGVAAGDFDNDGDLDVATTSFYSGMALWVETQPNGPGILHPIDVAFGRLRGIGAGDFDGDGDMDMAIASYDEDRFVWLENRHVQGVDTFLLHVLRDSTAGPWATIAADVNQDGYTDLVTLEYLGNVARIFVQSNGALTETAAFSVPHPMDATVVDYDNDGDSDVVVGAYSGNIVWLEQGTSGWSLHALSFGEGLTGVAAADLDGDGDVDLVGTPYAISSQVTWWERQSSGFVSHLLSGDMVYPRDVAVADFDNDGDMDIVASSQGGMLRWWQNNGGTFAARQTPDGSSLYNLTISDFDQDGDPDVLVADRGGERVLSYLNTMGVPSVVEGVVRSAQSNVPVANVAVRLVENGIMTFTDVGGHFLLHAASGTYSMATHHPCWNDAFVASVQAVSGDTTDVDVPIIRPILEMATSSLNLLVQNGGEVDAPLSLTNTGDGTLTIDARADGGTPGDDWLSVEPESTTVAAGDSFSFTVHVAPDTSNSQNWDYVGQIELRSNSCPDSVLSVAVVAYVLDAPNRDRSLPHEIALDPVYPNPFNATAFLRYELPTTQDVAIELFDVSGRHVATLVRGRESAGEHIATVAGANYASGIYFVDLTAGQTHLTRKALLLK